MAYDKQMLYTSSIADADEEAVELYLDVVEDKIHGLFGKRDLDKIQKRIRNLVNNLASCGLVARQTSNEDLRVILDNFLNGGRTTEFGTVVTTNG